jgi:3-deoxy-D-manno-octulosonic-acid transferase
MVILYNFAIFLLGLGLRIAGLFHPKAKAFVTGRKSWYKKMKEAFRANRSPLLWIHCASLGEFEQGRPIIEAMKSEFPDHKILLTFFSPSGYEVRQNYQYADFVFYLPLDTASNARKLIMITQPVLAIFVKYEFWYHYAHELNRRKIPILSVSSIFRQDQFFFHTLGSLSRKTLMYFSHFFVQNHESIQLLQSIGIKNSSHSGDTRFDRVYQIVQQKGEVAIAKTFKADQKVFVLGSCWTEDLEVLTPFINENKFKFIIAPHEISEPAIAELERTLQVKSVRYSQAAQTHHLEDYMVLIIDNIGLLSRLYRYGEFAYIGGAFGKGLHNILEAACYGVPILFGNKNYEKFQEAVDLINRGGAFEIADYPDLKNKYEMLNVPETFLLACEVTRQYVEENLGATEKIMAYCRKLLKNKSR